MIPQVREINMYILYNTIYRSYFAGMSNDNKVKESKVVKDAYRFKSLREVQDICDSLGDRNMYRGGCYLIGINGNGVVDASNRIAVVI